jgi:hypothetical protein
MKGYKGFNKDMTCRGMQYEEGKIYKMEEEPKCCKRGYHFCENPIDCLGYYSPNESIYRQVEAIGKISKDEDTSDTKIATNEIKIGAKIDFQTMVKMAIEFTYKHCTKKGKGNNKRSDKSVASNTGDYSVASNTGDYSVASNTGYKSVASNTGYKSVASNTGYKSVASNTGYNSVASNTGYKSVASNTGYKSVASNTGYNSVASNTGYNSVASNTGNYSVASNTGNYSVASNLGQKSISSCLGVRGQVSGKKGTWLVVAEWIQDEDWNWEVKEVKTVKVDGKKIKENTYYTLEHGEFVEKGSISDDND